MQPNPVLGISSDTLQKSGAVYTAQEIAQQPALWQQTCRTVLEAESQITTFYQAHLNAGPVDIIFTGAGTSAFIGNSLECLYQHNTGKPARAIATTNLATHPQHYFRKDIPTCLVSFARSGDSPESIAAVRLANQLCPTVSHIIITCNAEGTLAREATPENSLILLLPPETNDKGLAMTGSYTSMLLTGILLSHLPQLQDMVAKVDQLAEYGRRIIAEYTGPIQEMCALDIQRAVFLGSGPMLGCAEECHLKLQELTDGAVISKFDSFMGFRHGPKAVVNANSLMVYLISPEPYVQQYERDLIDAVNTGQQGLYRIGISENPVDGIELDLAIVLNRDNAVELGSDFLPVCYTLVGQLAGFYKSLQLGLQPDTPSASGTISRVVQGVTLYDFPSS
jgi:tagatose-6-phosphate ketose/aldose isomerase